MLKTIGCGEIRAADAGKDVTLAGWVHRRRDHGGLIFIDLRDRSGIVQVVLNPKESHDAHETGTQFRNEWVVQVEGRVGARPTGTENPDLATGEIEVGARVVKVLNPSRTPPFYVNEEVEVEEGLRLKHRYVDLRRQRLQRNIALRHRVVKYIRDFLDGEGFLEIETPVLIKSTPEGARDYLVPSRVHPGSFYALPQSPQQLKQLLMVSGFERYFQIARCFRDEDQRADRQPEFTQLDLEMSFVDDEDVLDLTEALFTGLVESVTPNFDLTKPFPRLSYDEVDEAVRDGQAGPTFRAGTGRYHGGGQGVGVQGVSVGGGGWRNDKGDAGAGMLEIQPEAAGRAYGVCEGEGGQGAGDDSPSRRAGLGGTMGSGAGKVCDYALSKRR